MIQKMKQIGGVQGSRETPRCFFVYFQMFVLFVVRFVYRFFVVVQIVVCLSNCWAWGLRAPPAPPRKFLFILIIIEANYDGRG